MQRGSRMTSAGFWADPAKTGQPEDLVAQLVLVGMWQTGHAATVWAHMSRGG
jgi:hypothetical protein